MIITCERCGTSVDSPMVAAFQAIGSWTCGSCNHLHQIGDAPPDPRFARAAVVLGATVTASSALVPMQPYNIELSIDFSSGTPMGLSLHARTPPLPSITFTRESSLDTATKKFGLTREAQLGDPSFDPHVWVDAEVSDEIVRAMLASPDARRAIVVILHTSHTKSNVTPSVDVKTTSYGVTASVGLDTLEDDQALRDVVAAFATLSRSLQPVTLGETIAEPSRFSVKLVFIAAAIFALVGFPSCIASAPHSPLFHLLMPFVYGGIAGICAWLLVLPIVFLVVRGKSSSLTTFVFAAGAWFIATQIVAINAMSTLNWALDDSPVVERKAQIVRVEPGHDSDSSWNDVTIRSWKASDDTATIRRHGPTELKRGSTIALRARDGFFGWPYLVE